MGSWVLRIVLFFVCGVSGYVFAANVAPSPSVGVLGFFGGLILAALTLLVEGELKKLPLKSLLGSLAGLLAGFIAASLIDYFFLSRLFDRPVLTLPLAGGLYGIAGYIGLRIGLRKGDELQGVARKPAPTDSSNGATPKILDTSVIIDGRISDITETGFLEGPLVIPQFVLSELQHIADSSDPVKRTRGKRGLDVLHHIQKQVDAGVQIVDKNYPAVKDVDSKLIQLAKEVHGKIITNDFNLNKVAELQGIDVLNINELANSLKPVVLPGEEMNVKILKEGKEMGQGIAYLDDGTMIVVDNGRRQMGKTIDVVVTSVLQTPAGRMIFARLKEEPPRDRKEAYYPLDSEF